MPFFDCISPGRCCFTKEGDVSPVIVGKFWAGCPQSPRCFFVGAEYFGPDLFFLFRLFKVLLFSEAPEAPESPPTGMFTL